MKPIQDSSHYFIYSLKETFEADRNVSFKPVIDLGLTVQFVYDPWTEPAIQS